MVLLAIDRISFCWSELFWCKSSADRANRQAREQVRMQNMQAMQERNFQNLQIRKQNEYARQAYETQVGLYEQQRQFNSEAANRAFTGVQLNRNRQLTAMAFQRQDRTNQPFEAVELMAAIEGSNRSARLAAAKRHLALVFRFR